MIINCILAAIALVAIVLWLMERTRRKQEIANHSAEIDRLIQYCTGRLAEHSHLSVKFWTKRAQTAFPDAPASQLCSLIDLLVHWRHPRLHQTGTQATEPSRLERLYQETQLQN